MTVAETIAAKIEGLEKVPEAWVNGITRYQPKLSAKLTRLLDQLTRTVDGAVEMTAQNMAAVDTIITELRAYMTQGEYVSLLTDLAEEFAAQEGRTIAYFTTAFGSDATTSTFAASVYARGRAALIADLVPENLYSVLWQPLRDTLTNGIATGSGYTDLLESVQALAQGTETADGALLGHSRQLVTDTLGVTDRAYTDIIANDLGLEWYAYLGGVVLGAPKKGGGRAKTTTRCFCLKRNGNYYHRKEIAGWGAGKGVGECGFPWAGMNKATNPETIFAYVGGYNCQHSLLPVSMFTVPKEAILEAMAKGYFNPTAKERELLGV